jgi:hypothetical protein
MGAGRPLRALIGTVGAMPTYTAKPILWDHQLVIGDTYQPLIVQLLQSTGAAYDLTGVTGEAVIQDEAGGNVLVTATVSIVDAAAGKFTWSAPVADTEDLQPGNGVYSVRLTWPSGPTRTILCGNVAIVALPAVP